MPEVWDSFLLSWCVIVHFLGYSIVASGLCIANNVLPGFNAYAYVKQYHYSVLNFLLAYIAHE